MKKFALACVAATYLVTPSMAGTPEPSARRLWILCFQEDPQCGPMFANAMMAAYVNPVFRGQKYNVPNPKNVNIHAVTISFMQNPPQYSDISAREEMIDLMRTFRLDR